MTFSRTKKRMYLRVHLLYTSIGLFFLLMGSLLLFTGPRKYRGLLPMFELLSESSYLGRTNTSSLSLKILFSYAP